MQLQTIWRLCLLDGKVNAGKAPVLPQFELTPKAFANFSPGLERSAATTLGK
jgi:hypothetical protein